MPAQADCSCIITGLQNDSTLLPTWVFRGSILNKTTFDIRSSVDQNSLMPADRGHSPHPWAPSTLKPTTTLMQASRISLPLPCIRAGNLPIQIWPTLFSLAQNSRTITFVAAGLLSSAGTATATKWSTLFIIFRYPEAQTALFMGSTLGTEFH